ncbi:MAG: M28 family peptidase [Planctomycetaceae bacterium]
MLIEQSRLREHVAELASAPRPANSPQLDTARRYVAQWLAGMGWTVQPEPFTAPAETGQQLSGSNLLAEHPSHRWTSRPRFCLGAHLDSRENSPGADDNASAVAALLEIARLLPERWPEPAALDLELVFFDLEEYGMLGGTHRARHCRREHVDLRGMASLEMLGYCDQAPASQNLPRSLVGKYPDVGNWIAVIGNQISADLIARFRDGLKTVGGLPVETLQVPDSGVWLQATRLSDHSPYWDEGYPALMITDTAFLRNPHYHLPTDTPETLDYDFLAKVTQGVLEAVVALLARGL